MDDVARTRITRWLDASKKTQVAFADEIGRNQAWMSRYLDGDFDADLDTLSKMARGLGHDLTTLIDDPPNRDLTDAWELFLALSPEARSVATQWFELMTKPPTGRKRSEKRVAGARFEPSVATSDRASTRRNRVKTS